MVDTDNALLDEATEELTNDVITALDEAEDVAPPAEEVTETPVNENPELLAALDDLCNTLNADAIAAELSEARKWFLLAEQAGGIEEENTLEQRMDALETIVDLADVLEHSITSDLQPAINDIEEALTLTADGKYEDVIALGNGATKTETQSIDPEDEHADTDTDNSRTDGEQEDPDNDNRDTDELDAADDDTDTTDADDDTEADNGDEADGTDGTDDDGEANDKVDADTDADENEETASVMDDYV